MREKLLLTCLLVCWSALLALGQNRVRERQATESVASTPAASAYLVVRHQITLSAESGPATLEEMGLNLKTLFGDRYLQYSPADNAYLIACRPNAEQPVTQDIELVKKYYPDAVCLAIAAQAYRKGMFSTITTPDKR